MKSFQNIRPSVKLRIPRLNPGNGQYAYDDYM